MSIMRNMIMITITPMLTEEKQEIRKTGKQEMEGIGIRNLRFEISNLKSQMD